MRKKLTLLNEQPKLLLNPTSGLVEGKTRETVKPFAYISAFGYKHNEDWRQ